MGVSGQRHAPAALCRGERTPGTHCTGGWVGPRAGLDTEARGKILCSSFVLVDASFLTIVVSLHKYYIKNCWFSVSLLLNFGELGQLPSSGVYFSLWNLCFSVANEYNVRFQVLTAASMMFRVVFWDVLPCKMIVDRRFRGAYCLHPWWWQLWTNEYNIVSLQSCVFLVPPKVYSTAKFKLNSGKSYLILQWHHYELHVQQMNVYRNRTSLYVSSQDI
jgi:hypothetical protein